MIPKLKPKSIDFQTFLKKAEMLETICFTIENVVLGTYKCMKIRYKIDAKSMPEKVMQKVCKIMPKLKPNGGQDRLKIQKYAKKDMAKIDAEI